VAGAANIRQPLYAPDGIAGANEALTSPTGLEALRSLVHAYDPRADLGAIDAAYAMAAAAHGTQTRDNGDPYITHPVAVAAILASYRLDTASIVTALLHDVIEDTPVSMAEPSRQRTSASWSWR